MMLPKKLRLAILERDGYRCAYCGNGSTNDVSLEVDHVIARAVGGSDDPTNLVTACKDCNSAKNAHPVAAPDPAVQSRPMPTWYVELPRRTSKKPALRNRTHEPVVHHWQEVAKAMGLDAPEFPVGRFFARWYVSKEDGERWWQEGVVIGGNAPQLFVRYFSAMDGGLLDSTHILSREPVDDWLFFDTDLGLRRWSFDQGARKGLWDGSEDHWRQCEAIVGFYAS